MEKDNREDEIRNRKKAYDEGIAKHNGLRAEAETNPTYIGCKEAWGRFLKGELTAAELAEHIRKLAESDETITDLYDEETEEG